MLSDKEVEEIERQRQKGVSGGPIVVSWVDRLLADRKERIRQLQYLRQRLNQAFRYLDGLLRDVQTSRPRPSPVSRANRSTAPAAGSPMPAPMASLPTGSLTSMRTERSARWGRL